MTIITRPLAAACIGVLALAAAGGGIMTDLGGLGGTLSLAGRINNRGLIAGQSYLAGNVGSRPVVFADGRAFRLDPFAEPLVPRIPR